MGKLKLEQMTKQQLFDLEKQYTAFIGGPCSGGAGKAKKTKAHHAAAPAKPTPVSKQHHGRKVSL